MSAYIELEIHALLNEYGDPGLAADKLIQGLEASTAQLNPENILATARFLLHCGFYATLLNFILRHIHNENFVIPWPYFVEAIAKIHPDLSDEAIDSLREGLLETNGEEDASRSEALDIFLQENFERRRNRRAKIHKAYADNKKNYLDQLITLRTQQLYEQEKELLSLLQKLYPGDNDVRNEIKEHQQRYALEILSRRSSHAKPLHFNEEPPLTEEQLPLFEVIFACMKEECALNPDIAYDFAISLAMLDCFDQALEILDLCPETEASNWLNLELLLKAHRYLELLQGLPRLEYVYAHESETFFATAYLRAQAMWGIGQKHTAIEIMESLLLSHPTYRSAPSILNSWMAL